MGKHYIGEVGTEIRLNCGTDISSSTASYIHCRKPDGSTTSWPATVYASNYLRYYTVAGDFDQDGVYRVQSGVTLAAWSGKGETATFEVTPDYL